MRLKIWLTNKLITNDLIPRPKCSEYNTRTKNSRTHHINIRSRFSNFSVPNLKKCKTQIIHFYTNCISQVSRPKNKTYINLKSNTVMPPLIIVSYDNFDLSKQCWKGYLYFVFWVWAWTLLRTLFTLWLNLHGPVAPASLL